MGLDMSIYSKDKDRLNEKDYYGEEIAYWRKHADLNQFMMELWYEKTGKHDEDFNCKDFVLDEDTVKEIIGVLTMRNLPKGSTGFFWGISSHTDEETQQDVEFFERALEEIREGNLVYYFANW